MNSVVLLVSKEEIKMFTFAC